MSKFVGRKTALELKVLENNSKYRITNNFVTIKTFSASHASFWAGDTQGYCPSPQDRKGGGRGEICKNVTLICTNFEQIFFWENPEFSPLPSNCQSDPDIY